MFFPPYYTMLLPTSYFKKSTQKGENRKLLCESSHQMKVTKILIQVRLKEVFGDFFVVFFVKHRHNQFIKRLFTVFWQKFQKLLYQKIQLLVPKSGIIWGKNRNPQRQQALFLKPRTKRSAPIHCIPAKKNNNFFIENKNSTSSYKFWGILGKKIEV